jgi:hypothetical protein
MRKADPDIQKYAFELGFLTGELAYIVDSGGTKRIPRMIRALGCERQRLVALDPKIGLSVPGTTRLEEHCGAI